MRCGRRLDHLIWASGGLEWPTIAIGSSITPAVGVADIHKSARFYEAALRPLGIQVMIRITRGFKLTNNEGPELGGVGYGIDYPMFWIDVFHPHGAPVLQLSAATTQRNRAMASNLSKSVVWLIAPGDKRTVESWASLFRQGRVRSHRP
jgi:hypothetical protein